MTREDVIGIAGSLEDRFVIEYWRPAAIGPI